MAPGKGQPTVRAARLKQHGSALWRRLAEVITLDLIELARVFDLVHFVGPGVDALRGVVEHGVVFPTAFPEFVEHFQVFVGLVVTAVVFHLFGQAHGLGGAVQVAGDDVPAHAATGQVVEGRHAPCEQIRRLVGEVGGQTKTEVFGDGGHG